MELSKEIVQRLSKPQPVPFPQQCATSLEREASVIAINGFSGPLRGVISPNSSMMRLPGSRTFQELWTVRLSNALGKSDEVTARVNL